MVQNKKEVPATVENMNGFIPNNATSITLPNGFKIELNKIKPNNDFDEEVKPTKEKLHYDPFYDDIRQ